MNFILSIDQGTSGTTAILANEDLKILAKSNIVFRQIFPKTDWVEHRETDIWNSIQNSVKNCLNISKINPKKIATIAITNQRETTAIFNKKGQLMHNLVVWQCKRSVEICEKLKTQGFEKLFYNKSGLKLDPYFSGTKLSWLFKYYPHLKKYLFGTVDSWILYRMTNNKIHATDATNASRTLMMNLESCQWDKDLLKVLKIPEKCLPSIRSNCEVYGYTEKLNFLPDGIPISCLIGDQQAALFGLNCLYKGQVKATYGTGCFIMIHTGLKPIFSSHNLLTSIALKTKKKTTYCLEGSAFMVGAIIDWAINNMKFAKSTWALELLAQEVLNSLEITFIPALTGLGAPYWHSKVRGMFSGITRSANAKHFTRAIFEGIALLNCDILKAIKQETKKITDLKTDGGAALNNFLLQTQTNLSGMRCRRAICFDATAIGALSLAGLNIGLFEEIGKINKICNKFHEFTPKKQKTEILALEAKWNKNINAIKNINFFT